MSLDATVLADLAKACDNQARPADDGDVVAGVPARFVVAPRSTDETAEVLRVAAQHDLRTVARGRGTRLGWGGAPTAVDVLLDTGGITGVVEHAAGDLITVVRAGTTLADLQDALSGADQELALDDPQPGSSVGGVIATSPSGPRRLLRGTVRDLLIGITFVRADGVVAKAGGKVVKNVAGYDFAKLLAGSYGTLGVVTEAAFRLHPRPPSARVLAVTTHDPGGVAGAVLAVLGSQVVPSAVEVDQPPEGPSTVAVLLEGTATGVAERAATTTTLLGNGHEGQPSWWGRYPFDRDGTGLRLTTRISGLATLLEAARRAGDRHGAPVAVRGSAAGVLHAGLPAGTDPAAVAAVVADLRAEATTYDGSVVVLTAPGPVRSAVDDLWGPVPGLDLMRRVKDEMDPGHRLAPGRFVGGI